MYRTATRKIEALLLGIGLLAVVVSGCATMGGSFVGYTDDESTMEREIGEYLESQGLTLDYRSTNDDLYLVLAFKGDIPTYYYFIDNFPSHQSESGQVLERVIGVRLSTQVTVSEENEAEVLKKLNSHNANSWAGTFYINEKTREIEGYWPFNVLAGRSGVDKAAFLDALQRLNGKWGKLYEDIEDHVAEMKKEEE